MVAIDGFRLVIRHEKINASEKYYFVVPSKALMELRAFSRTTLKTTAKFMWTPNMW